MVFDKGTAAAELDEHAASIRGYLDDDDDLIERYREAFRALPEATNDEIRDALSHPSYPGALPTKMLDEADSIIHDHPESASWESHEVVNNWAREVLLGVPMLAVDGSEIPPTTQFNVPVAYIQAAWCVNHHSPDGHLERGRSEQLLSPEEISRKSDDGDYRVDSSLAGHHRYEHEGELLIDRMEHLNEKRDAGDLDRPPVVLYDGPLVVAFVTSLDETTRQRYIDTMSDIIVASQHLKIPLVGYVAGTDTRDLAKMVQNLPDNELDNDPVIPDARVLSGLTSQWGDRTTPFVCRRNWSVDTLSGTYGGDSYDFSEDLLFSYMQVPPGTGLDRVEFPGWLTREEGPEGYETMSEYAIEMVRAEAAVGRGYPELLQQADSDAVLDQHDRKQFHRLLQNWAEENDISLEWDAKALSKELRRR
jgi:hypothetical protein